MYDLYKKTKITEIKNTFDIDFYIAIHYIILAQP